jgi:hypothetical protein
MKERILFLVRNLHSQNEQFVHQSFLGVEMFSLKKLLILLLLSVLVAGSTWAASAGFNVQIRLRTPISITKVTDLDFGTVETGTATYTVNANAGPHSAGAAATSASFTVSGESGAVANVTVPASTVVTSGANNLTVSLAAQAATFTFTGASQTFYVGGSVDVTGAPAGLYTGSSTLTMLYQ